MAKKGVKPRQKLTQQACAALLGLSPRRLRDSDCPRNTDGSYDAAMSVGWRLESTRRVGETRTSSRETVAQRRQRIASAKLSELTLSQRQSQLLSRQQTHEVLGRIASIIRSAGETLARDYGDGARQLLDEALDDVDKMIDRHFGPTTPS